MFLLPRCFLITKMNLSYVWKKQQQKNPKNSCLHMSGFLFVSSLSCFSFHFWSPFLALWSPSLTDALKAGQHNHILLRHSNRKLSLFFSGAWAHTVKEKKKESIYINILYVYTYIILHYFLGIILIFCGSIQMYKLMCYHNPDRNTFIIKIHWLFCRVSNLLCLHLFFMAFSRSCNI